MAASDATTVDAAGREVRVSSPDRVIFPATDRTPEVTKLDVVEYYLAVGDGIMRALRRRPTTLERWPKGVHEGIVLSTRERGGGDAFFQKRVPKGAPDYLETARIEFPSGRHADEICPTELAVVAWCGHMGTITFHPWPVRADDVDHPDELRIDLDPQPGTDFADAVRVAGTARELLERPRLRRLPEDLGRARRAHLRAHRAALDVHRRAPRGDRLRPRARAPAAGRGHDEVVEGGARRAHLRRLQPERPRPHDRVGLLDPPEAGRAGLGAGDVGRAARRRARGLHRRDDAGALRRDRRPPRGDRRRAPLPRAAARALRSATRQGDMPYPPDYPKMPGEPKRVQPSRDRDRKQE